MAEQSRKPMAADPPGMGLRLAGTVPRRTDCTYWQLQVLYHSPMAMQAGTLGPQNRVVGGGMGMRYLIKGSTIAEHGSSDDQLISDRYSSVPVSSGLLQPKDATWPNTPAK